MISLINKSFSRGLLFIAVIRLRVDAKFKKDFLKIFERINSLSIKNYQYSDTIILAIISIEDKRFQNHCGVDIYAILRAFYRRLFYKKIEGGSTIEQQLVRTITERREITIRRKITEILLAVLLGKQYEKIEIINSYCCIYNFNDCTGIHALCVKEHIDFKKASIQQASTIVARLKYPIITSTNYIRYLKRVRTIEIITSELLVNSHYNKCLKGKESQFKPLIQKSRSAA